MAFSERHGDVSRLDRIMEAEHDSVNNYQASKQADVLMLPCLLSANELEEMLGELGYSWTSAQLPATIDYYLSADVSRFNVEHACPRLGPGSQPAR